MPSAALAALLEGLAEIDALQRANPTPDEGGGFTRPEIVRAIGRAEVVLLSSHFERYLYSVNQEAVTWLMQQAVAVEQLPVSVRLLHSRGAVDALAATQWDNRAGQLREYSEKGAPLWIDGTAVPDLDADRLLDWMKAPKCQDVVRFYRAWTIEDIFSAVTRTPVTRGRLWLRIGELVNKRNNIAHGDLAEEARYSDIKQYRAAVRKFCTSADKAFARALAKVARKPRPW